MPERVGGEEVMAIKDRLYEITKNMPKDEALAFLDRYKDNLKYHSSSEKRSEATRIDKIIKDLKILK